MPLPSKLLRQIEKYLRSHYRENVTFSVKLDGAIQDIDAATEEQETFAEYFFSLLAAKDLSDVELYKKAHIDRRIFSKIRTKKDYTPSKKTILAFAVALELSPDEADDLLDRAGYSLSRFRKEDMVIQYFLENRCFDFFLINEALAHYGFSPLGER